METGVNVLLRYVETVLRVRVPAVYGLICTSLEENRDLLVVLDTLYVARPRARSPSLRHGVYTYQFYIRKERN